MAIGVFGLEMKPVYGALAMSLSSFCVCMNALRLNLFKAGNKNSVSMADQNGLNENQDYNDDAILGSISVDNNINNKEQEGSRMKKEISIEGMMCEHCEMSVKKALLAVDGVVSAEVSHKDGKAVVELSDNVDDNALKTAVEAKDYKVLGITDK